ncbi:MAG: hypothetical protein Kow0065_16510 [Methylomicrobium sp.]
MNFLILTSLFLPLASFIGLFLTENHERKIASLSTWSSHAMGASIIALLIVWSASGFPNHEFEWFTLYAAGDYRFPILFYLDRTGAVYLFCTWTVFSVIVKYCRVYLHRETGYQRFFMTIFGFAFGLNTIILSGTIDLLFAGWEIVGISSFVLIAFYRHRAQPIRNALRAYSIYRLCDIGLLLGAWMSHLLFHESQHFSQLATLFDNDFMPPAGYGSLLVLSLLILVAASGKSAQFPFCFWLPRAMEGPTPSSAIFYGALSVHLGVFLLLRTMPIWSFHVFTRLLVLLIGLSTIAIATLSEKTQSNIKGQIAYASIAQVGFMFVELAFGLETLVLVHFLGNAFLRCYQLLVSPSVVAHLLRVEGATDSGFYIDQTPKFRFLPASLRNTLPEVLQNTLYVLSLQEGYLDIIVRGLLWTPLKRAGAKINAMNPWLKWLIATGVITLSAFGPDHRYPAILLSILSVLASFSAFGQKHHAFGVWNAIGLSTALAGAAVLLLEPQAWVDTALFASGIVPAWLTGLFVLSKMLKLGHFEGSPFAYRALAETEPRLSFLFFLSFLGLTGFPISPAFLGEDLLLAHAGHHAAGFALPIALSFVINGIAAARVYQRLCMGRPSELNDYPVTREFDLATINASAFESLARPSTD